MDIKPIKLPKRTRIVLSLLLMILLFFTLRHLFSTISGIYSKAGRNGPQHVKEKVYVFNKQEGIQRQYFTWVRKKYPTRPISDDHLGSLGSMVAWNSMYINQELSRKYKMFKGKKRDELTFQDYEKALEKLEQLDIPDPSKEYEHLNLLALMSLMTADFGKSRDYFIESGELNPEKGQANHFMLAILAEVEGDYQEAIERLFKDLRFKERQTPDNGNDQAQTLERIAWNYTTLGDYSNALKYMQAARSRFSTWLAKNPQPDNWLADYDRKIGQIYYYDDKFPEALAVLNKSIISLESSKHSEYFLSNAYSMTGIVYMALQRRQQAIEAYQKSLGILLKLDGGWDTDLANTHHLLGKAYLNGQMKAQARNHLQKSLLIYSRLYGINSRSAQSVRKSLSRL